MNTLTFQKIQEESGRAPLPGQTQTILPGARQNRSLAGKPLPHPALFAVSLVPHSQSLSVMALYSLEFNNPKSVLPFDLDT